MSDDKRIYVVVAEAVIVWPEQFGCAMTIKQPAGRIAAQCSHVVSKSRHGEMGEWKPYTTIILSARNNKELSVLRKLLNLNNIPNSWFEDTNEEAYYGPDCILTAICTGPIYPTFVDGILDHLPLWSA